MVDEELDKAIRHRAYLPWEGREAKLRKKKAKLKQHGKGLGKIYKAVVEKRGGEG
jgi:hypothetical protein